MCSRSDEHVIYSTRLQLNGAIYLQLLTNNQICTYLRNIKSKAFMAITEQTAITTVVKGSIRYFKYVYPI